MKLKVGDANDNYPAFDEKIYAVLVSENATIGSEVTRVTATDLDSGVNSELTYTLTGGDGYFFINRTTGKRTKGSWYFVVYNDVISSGVLFGILLNLLVVIIVVMMVMLIMAMLMVVMW